MAFLMVSGCRSARRSARSAIAIVPGAFEVGTVAIAERAWAAVNRLAPDVVLLDADLPGVEDIGHFVTSANRSAPSFVVLPRQVDNAVAAFDAGVVDFVTKPIKPDRLAMGLERARVRRAEMNALSAKGQARVEEPTLTVPDRHGGYLLRVAEIISISADRDYALIRTATREHIVRVTMAELARRLPDGFARVHRSAIISLAHVRR